MKSSVKGWTDGRFRSFITSALRGGFSRFPNKYNALKDAFVSKKVNKKSGRVAAHYRCAGCSKTFPSKDVQVDHILPVVDPITGFVGWDVYIQRMFCPPENLQVLCKPCHASKTKKERKTKCKS